MATLLTSEGNLDGMLEHVCCRVCVVFSWKDGGGKLQFCCPRRSARNFDFATGVDPASVCLRRQLRNVCGD